MQKWEYKSYKSDRDEFFGIFSGDPIKKLEKELNVLGEEGWEFVGPGLNNGANTRYLIFQNDKKNYYCY